MPSIHEQLSPLIRAVGVNEVARRSGVDRSMLSSWLSGRHGPSGVRRQLREESVEALARAVGATIVISTTTEEK